MDFYIYCAELFCEDCAKELPIHPSECGRLGLNHRGDEEWSSDDFRKGPFYHEGEEFDAPQHCKGCGVFLMNCLTDEGMRYVQEAIGRFLRNEGGDRVTLCEWNEFYALGFTIP